MPSTEPTVPLGTRLRRLLFGAPRDLEDRALLHRIALVPLLAWVGLGADGLSSSAYGPEEAFRTLGAHTYLAIPLAGMMALTVFVLSACYNRIIERFPQGGGGYLVATALLGKRAGVVSGCALLVDYVLTITVSIAAAGSALFSFLPLDWQPWKLPCEIAMIFALVALNLRGVRESVLVLAPIFLVFAITHVVVIGGGIIGHLPELPGTVRTCATDFQGGLGTLGLGGMLLLFVHAYSFGGGTYTGIEAVSNGLTIMREPRVHTAQRTMLYMAVSLAVTAAGLLICYLLWQVAAAPGKTLNAVLLEGLTKNMPGGGAFTVLTLLSEGALLVVAAQTGFIDGPRVLANMALDGWVPRRFAQFSDRLTTQNGIVLMGAASLLALWHTRGEVHRLVIMYSINVFITFSLSTFGMSLWSLRSRADRPHWMRQSTLFVGGFLLCGVILSITVVEKFEQGGWLTLAVTSAVVTLCFLIHRHYDTVAARLKLLHAQIAVGLPKTTTAPLVLDPAQPTAAILVGEYGGLGIHTMANVFRAFPGTFKNLAFLSVATVDSGELREGFAIENLKRRTEESLTKYVSLANAWGVPATSRYAIGTDVVDEAETLCGKIAVEFPRVTFFAGKLSFQRERWYERFLHNQTAFALQQRLHWAGLIMVILPVRLR